MTDTGASSAKRVFIVGCRRSGTTWVTMLLAQHPQVVAIQQSGFFLRIDYLAKWVGEQVKFGRTVLTPADGEQEQDGGVRRQTLGHVVPLEHFYRHIRPLAEEVYGEVVRYAPGADVVVDHQPENARVQAHIRGVFPDAWFLHVIRDPRSVYSSFRHAVKSWSSTDTFNVDPVHFGGEWTSDVAAGRSIAAETDHYVEVRYEKLSERGPEELLAIYHALGLPADLDQCRAAIEACTVDKLRKGAHGPRGFFRRGEVAGWRKELSGSKIRTVEYVCRELMDELGYERVNATFARRPYAIWKRDFLKRASEAGTSWAKQGDGWFSNAIRGVFRVLPGVRKRFWNQMRR